MNKILAIFGLVFFLISCTNEIPSEDVECVTDTDCVPSGCCHPSECVPRDQAPDCDDTFCTLECQPGTLDCGQGSCLCVNGKCNAVFE